VGAWTGLTPELPHDGGGRSPRALLRDLLRAHARPATLVADQLDALEAGDRERFDALDAERRAQQAELAALAQGSDGDGADIDRALAAATAELDRPAEHPLLDHLTYLQAQVHGLGLRRFEWGHYEAEPQRPQPAPSQLDVRF
jgi:hypothetical protein